MTCAGLARAEVVQRGDVRVSFTVGAKISATNGQSPPQLRRISIAINRNGHFEPKGLPVCPLREIQPSTTADALAACGGSLVGTGKFSASVLFTEQAPFPSVGKIYAFNSRLHGHPAILAHVYGTKPVPTSFTVPFELRSTKGTYGTLLQASLPEVTGNSSHITGLQLTLGRNFSAHGKKRSYLSAGCPAPKGFPGTSFPFAKASLAFAKGKTVTETLTRSCNARGS